MNKQVDFIMLQGTVRQGGVRWGMVRFGQARFGMVLRGKAWHGMVRDVCDVEWVKTWKTK